MTAVVFTAIDKDSISRTIQTTNETAKFKIPKLPRMTAIVVATTLDTLVLATAVIVDMFMDEGVKLVVTATTGGAVVLVHQRLIGDLQRLYSTTLPPLAGGYTFTASAITTTVDDVI
jgi:hypothetical protein